MTTKECKPLVEIIFTYIFYRECAISGAGISIKYLFNS